MTTLIGAGKSTLLEAVAVKLGFNAEGGSRNLNFATRPTHSVLHRFLRLERGIARPSDGYFLRAESLYNVATELEKLDEVPSGSRPLDAYGGESLHAKSHGEAFLALLLHRLRGNGIYLFDEPEAALSPQRQLAILSLIHRLVRQCSQLIIATHSPILLAYPHARIYLFAEGGFSEVKYAETEHYRVTRDFLNRHERMLEMLLAPDDETPTPEALTNDGPALPRRRAGFPPLPRPTKRFPAAQPPPALIPGFQRSRTILSGCEQSFTVCGQSCTTLCEQSRASPLGVDLPSPWD